MLVSARPRLLFVSPQFLFPTDAGGKIRTTNILRGMKGGRFEITLASPASPEQQADFAAEIDSVCDRHVSWPPNRSGIAAVFRRFMGLLSELPNSVAVDRTNAGARCVARLLGERPGIVVVDFAHAAVLTPSAFAVPAVMFTHNVEAEIFRRHIEFAANPLMRAVWRREHRKMLRFEARELPRYDTVIAVSDRDDAFFRKEYGIRHGAVIPTAVDLDFFRFSRGARRNASAPRGSEIVFTGSMDWRANIDAIEYFMAEIWPLIAAARPDAKLTIVGRNPPAHLVSAARDRALPWTFTGFVADVRPYIRDADVYVIPLRVGGGTRIKVYEAMAMGSPVVSTAIGVEGLPVEPGKHFLQADRPEDFARSVLDVLADPARGDTLAERAFDYVNANFGAKRVAEIFEAICFETFERVTAGRRA